MGVAAHGFVAGALIAVNAVHGRRGMRPALCDLLNTSADGLAGKPGTESFLVSMDPNDAKAVDGGCGGEDRAGIHGGNGALARASVRIQPGETLTIGVGGRGVGDGSTLSSGGAGTDATAAGRRHRPKSVGT